MRAVDLWLGRRRLPASYCTHTAADTHTRAHNPTREWHAVALFGNELIQQLPAPLCAPPAAEFGEEGELGSARTRPPPTQAHSHGRAQQSANRSFARSENQFRPASASKRAISIKSQ